MRLPDLSLLCRALFGRSGSSRDAIRLDSSIELSWGGTAIVSLLRYSNGCIEVEKKLLPRFQGSADGEMLIDREFSVLSALDHPFIVRPFRIQRGEPNSSAIILEYIRGFSLADLMPFIETLTPAAREQWAHALVSQLICAMHYLKSKNIVHGDISPENILLTEGGMIKLIDFGVARFVIDPPLPYAIAGRPYFRAPEIRISGESSFAGDVYSVGRVLEWILEGVAKHNLSDLIQRLTQDRELPPVELNADGWFEPISPLPADSQKISGTIRAITELEFRGRFFYKYALQVRFAAACVMTICLSSWLPQIGYLTVNSLPYSHFTIDQVPDEIFETPVRSYPVRSGEVTIRFVIPNQNQRRVIRKLRINPQEQAKLFEDFQNVDKF